MKKSLIIAATLTAMMLSIAYAAQIWELSGTAVQKTIVSESVCESVLYEQ